MTLILRQDFNESACCNATMSAPSRLRREGGRLSPSPTRPVSTAALAPSVPSIFLGTRPGGGLLLSRALSFYFPCSVQRHGDRRGTTRVGTTTNPGNDFCLVPASCATVHPASQGGDEAETVYRFNHARQQQQGEMRNRFLVFLCHIDMHAMHAWRRRPDSALRTYMHSLFRS